LIDGSRRFHKKFFWNNEWQNNKAQQSPTISFLPVFSYESVSGKRLPTKKAEGGLPLFLVILQDQ
jgi:hypothetical protein